VTGIQCVAATKVVKILDTNLHVSLQWTAMPTNDRVGWCWVAEKGRRGDRGLHDLLTAHMAQLATCDWWL